MELQFFVTCREFHDETDFVEEFSPTIHEVFNGDSTFTIENIEVGNIGRGADIVGLLISIGAVGYWTFTQGKVIDENLEAWPKIMKRLSDIFDEVTKKLGSVLLIDMDTARIMALAEILKDDSVKSVELDHEHKVALYPLEWREKGNLDREPESYYFFYFNVSRDGDDSLETFTVTSSRKILNHQRHTLHWHDFE